MIAMNSQSAYLSTAKVFSSSRKSYVLIRFIVEYREGDGDIYICVCVYIFEGIRTEICISWMS